MTIGFIVPNITSSKVIPDKSLSRSATTSVRVAKFGDGYQQRVADGLNSIAALFSITLANRSKTDIDDIVAFFELNRGVTSFNFTYPDTNSTSTYSGNTGTTPSSGASHAVTMNASQNNLNISVGASVAGGGMPADSVVTGVTGANVVLSTSQDIDGLALTFTNPNERTVKVICAQWDVTYSNSSFYNLNTSFERVFEA